MVVNYFIGIIKVKTHQMRKIGLDVKNFHAPALLWVKVTP